MYLLIINTPDECVIGGDAKGVKRLIAMLDCRFFPLKGVTTAHCEVSSRLRNTYRDLHLFTTAPPAESPFTAEPGPPSYEVTRESAADAILAQAMGTIDFPAVIENAYRDGVRTFSGNGTRQFVQQDDRSDPRRAPTTRQVGILPGRIPPAPCCGL